MTDSSVRAYVIGQTPRPDLTRDLHHRFPSTSFEVVGALDGVRSSDVPRSPADGYPLETRLRDGNRVVVDAAFVEARLQRAIDAAGSEVVAHLILCAGPFPALSTTGGAALIRPFDIAAGAFAQRGYHRLEVLVPFAAQASPAAAKWEGAGYAVRTHILGGRTAGEPLADWVASRVADADADAVVFDYVGYPSQELHEVAGGVDVPVYDLGLLAHDALEGLLGAP